MLSKIIDSDVVHGKQTGSARIYAQLRQEILRVQLAPGSPLDEASLSERLGMSRSPIREALVRLSSEGLVVILPNRSSIVAPIDFQGIPHYLDALDLLQRANTRLAALHRTDDDLRRISSAQRRYEEAAKTGLSKGDSVPLIEANHDFHMAIARAGKNPYFMAFYRRLLDEGRRLLHFHFQYQTLDPELSVEKMASDHRAMFKAVKARDVESAENVAHAHATQFKGQFMQYLDQNVTAEMRLEMLVPSLEERRAIRSR